MEGGNGEQGCCLQLLFCFCSVWFYCVFVTGKPEVQSQDQVLEGVTNGLWLLFGNDEKLG
jgi:hypothetical protein